MGLWAELFGESFSYNSNNLENQIMCGTKVTAGPKQGETWYINGKAYLVGNMGYLYFESNGDPDKLYMTMADANNGTPFLITEDAFMKKAVKEKPSIERFITPDEILRNNPCHEGVDALLDYISVKRGENEYVTGANLVASGQRFLALSIKQWYKKTNSPVPTSWLVFLAKALKLIPQGSLMDDRATLKRLLGIK